MTDLSDRIRLFIVTEIMLREDPSLVTDKTRLIGGVMDSLGLMQLVAFLQSELDVIFEEDEIVPENFHTVADVERLVNRKLAGPVSPGSDRIAE